MLNENERQELKEKNLNLIDNWVKEFCSDGGYYKIEHAFRSNGKDFRISASKEGINLETMIAGTEIILHWKEIKSRIIAKREESEQTEELMRNFTV